MEASSSVRRRIGGNSPGGMLSSRRGALTIAVVAAVIAGLLIFVFVQQYKKSATATATNTPVYVATSLIPRGTPASLIASGGLFQRTAVKPSQVQIGAIADSSVLHGEVSTTAIYPGQQLTAADFSHSVVTVASQLTGPQRGIAIPVDSTHGLIGFVQAGDYVDVLSSFASGNGRGVVSTLATNVLVLSAPSAAGGGGLGGGGNSGGNIVLRVTAKTANTFAYAADNGKVWITLRPPVGATQ
jgi:Flp pilus assembly protein CpaB